MLGRDGHDEAIDVEGDQSLVELLEGVGPRIQYASGGRSWLGLLGFDSWSESNMVTPLL